MLRPLADLAISSRRKVLGGSVLVLLVAGAFGGPAQTLLQARNDFEDPGSQAAAARTQIEHATGGEPEAGVLALVSEPPGSTAVRSALATASSDRADVFRAGPPIPSRDGRITLVPVTLRAAVQDNDAVDRLTRLFAARRDVQLGGSAVTQREVGKQVSRDLGLAEAIVFPLLAALAFVFFRGIAALLPLAAGLLAILVTFAILRLVNLAFPLSVFALNLVIGLGLGLAVDYSLFLVSRFREELASGEPPPGALRATMATAGRTIVFSALTVAAALASLTVFPLRFLQSMGIGGVIVALVAAAVSLVVTPAAMLALGPRIGRHRPPAQGEGAWYAVAQRVMRRPGAVALLSAACLCAAAVPALGTRWAGVDASILPAGQSARTVSERVAARFSGTDTTPMTIAVAAAAGDAHAVAGYAAAVSRVSGVSGVSRPRYLGRDTWQLDVAARGAAISPAAQATLDRIRSLQSSLSAAAGGQAADFHDRQAAIGRRLPLALMLLAGTTLLILWVMTGSVILPVKALVMNALTVGVTTGVLVLIFQDGRLTSLLGYRSQGAIESTDFLVLVAVSFALSTDYGVFLLTRIREARSRGAAEREAVALGVQRTGGIISAAAILLAVAIGAFAASKVIFIKEIGVGAVAAVLVDAFIVRTLLVPSLMALLGRWNWWQPAPLRRLQERALPFAPEG